MLRNLLLALRFIPHKANKRNLCDKALGSPLSTEFLCDGTQRRVCLGIYIERRGKENIKSLLIGIGIGKKSFVQKTEHLLRVLNS